MINLSREEKIDLCIKIISKLEKTENRKDLNKVQKQTIRSRMKNVREQLAELCMSNEELQELINARS
ncbi:MAG: hypothetical protein ABFD02_08160 [Bacteroidales bacterium]